MYKSLVKRKLIVKSDNIVDVELYTFFRNFYLPFTPQKGMFISFSSHEFPIENVSFIEERDTQSSSLCIDLSTFEIPVEEKETLNQQLKIMTQCGFDYTLL